jgi:D-alanine-D-alanine ligase-like ATP-grasp enzyme
VLAEARRADRLAWIHRAEARRIAAELGSPVRVFDERSLQPGPFLLRLSDPVMLRATQLLTRAGIAYAGPGAATMELCYDKLAATRLAAAQGIECPATELAESADAMAFPLLIKPRRGSDSIGIRILPSGPIPRRYRNEHLAQELVRGAELTVAVLGGVAGSPLRIDLPEGTPYSFMQKYLLRPRRGPLRDAGLAERICETALKIAALLGVDWAARIDFIHESRSGRLCFLECDVAPLIGKGSAFCDSLLAGGIDRPEQLRLLSA